MKKRNAAERYPARFCKTAPIGRKSLTKTARLWYDTTMERTFRPVLSVRIFAEDKCFGPGVAELLRRVKELHSLRAAASSMAMAYSKAWTVIRAAEGCLGYKLLISTTGGKHGGGATVSPEAEKLLAAYNDYCGRVRAFAAEEFRVCFDGILNME